jgi:hypothetical protein
LFSRLDPRLPVDRVLHGNCDIFHDLTVSHPTDRGNVKTPMGVRDHRA